MGLKLRYFSPSENLKEVSAFFDEKEKVIYVNTEDSAKRQLFSVAHELGHYLLDHDVKDYGVLLRLATPIDKDPCEQEANFFAASILVPKEMLRNVVARYPSARQNIRALARYFGVSPIVIKYRLKWI